jgi:hypothetical protein
MNIQQFSWFDFQQQIIHLPKLDKINIGEDILSATNNIFNVLSCQDLSSKWKFTYRLIQTCSCQFLSFLNTIHRSGNFYRCPNFDNTIDFIDDICQLNGKEYKIQNQTNFICNHCLSYHCSNGTFCAETFDSEPMCLLPFRDDYETIRTRIPFTSYTKPFLFEESRQYLSINPNQTIDSSSFNSVAMILIGSNQNRTDISATDAQMFYQTVADILSRPWSPEIYASASSTTVIWQYLILALDQLIKNINDNETTFEFQSTPISTISLHLPTNQQSPETFDWEITNDNKITANMSNQNITSRVLLKFNNNPLSNLNCMTS